MDEGGVVNGGLCYYVIMPQADMSMDYPLQRTTTREQRIDECNANIRMKCSCNTFETVLSVKSPDDGVMMFDHPELEKAKLLETALNSGMVEVIQHFAKHNPDVIRATNFRKDYSVCIYKACTQNNIQLVNLLMDPSVGNLGTNDITEAVMDGGSVREPSALTIASHNNYLHIVEFFANNEFITPHAAQVTLEQLQKRGIDNNSCTRLLKELAKPRVKGAME